DKFSAACNAFGLMISIKKTEVIHQPPPTPKQIQGVKQKQPVCNFPETPIQEEPEVCENIYIPWECS
uniref:hypothetical protein n=1 Tax=Escherichia coli TaxID=562 RepID=UPI00321AA890